MSTGVTKMMPLVCIRKLPQLKQKKLFRVILVDTNPEGHLPLGRTTVVQNLCSHYYSTVLFHFTISLVVSFLG